MSRRPAARSFPLVAPVLIACALCITPVLHAEADLPPSAADVPPQLLILPPTEEPAHVVIHAAVEPVDRDRAVGLAYQFDSEGRTRMRVATPWLETGACGRPPNLEGDGFGWSPGWIDGQTAAIARTFGTEFAVAPRQRQTVVLRVVVPAGCPRITGGFELTLR